MKKTDSKQTIARNMVKVAWQGKAKLTTKKGKSQRNPDVQTLTDHTRFELTIPGSGQVRERVYTWGAFGNTNEVWESFLSGKLRPVIRESFIQATLKILDPENKIQDPENLREQVAQLADRILGETQSPADIKDPATHALACALSPRGNWLLCDGEAHHNPHIDNCGTCAPNWGWVSVPLGIHSWEQYRMRRDREQDSATWKD